MFTIKGIKYVEIKDYAKLKGKTLQTVYNWISDNKVETKKILGKTLIKL